MDTSKTPRIGDVYLVRFEGSGSEQTGVRPAVVFQNNMGNLHSPNVIVLPLTSKYKKPNQPTHVIVPADGTGLKLNSMVLCENPVCISKHKLQKYMTTLPQEYMAKIAEANLLASSAICYIDPTILKGLWERAARMNSVSPA